MRYNLTDANVSAHTHTAGLPTLRNADATDIAHAALSAVVAGSIESKEGIFL